MRLKGTEMVTVKYQLWVEGLTQQLALLPLPGFNFMSSGSTPPLPVTVLFAFPSSSWFLACPGRTLSRLGDSHQHPSHPTLQFEGHQTVKNITVFGEDLKNPKAE